ncbi:MAG: hypothetical protein LBB76_01570, partial [Azoarcus sp.]|nr:hypothetical protein [Azoarcus sp.]
MPEAVVGLIDIPTGGAVGKFLENEDGAFGFRPRQAREALDEYHTDAYKQQKQDFANADGIINKAGVALSNPSLITNTIVESILPMLVGGTGVRAAGITNGLTNHFVKKAAALGSAGVQAAKQKGAVLAGAIGEGAMMAGAAAEQIRGENDDKLLTPGQSAAALGTGAAGTLFGYGGGRLANRLGINDIDTAFAGGATRAASAASAASARSLPRRVIEGAIQEGFFEELPQSVSEQILQNLAL